MSFYNPMDLMKLKDEGNKDAPWPWEGEPLEPVNCFYVANPFDLLQTFSVKLMNSENADSAGMIKNSSCKFQCIFTAGTGS